MLRGLKDRFVALDKARLSYLASVSDADAAQLRFSPAPGAWSMLDVTEHLVLAEEKSLAGMLKGPPAGTTVTPLAHLRMALVRLVLKTNIRVKVPVARVVPQGTATLSELVARWGAARRGLELALDPITRDDERVARFRHPIAGWVTADEGVAFLSDHIGHHRRQVIRIRRAAGSPSS